MVEFSWNSRSTSTSKLQVVMHQVMPPTTWRVIWKVISKIWTIIKMVQYMKFSISGLDMWKTLYHHFVTRKCESIAEIFLVLNLSQHKSNTNILIHPNTHKYALKTNYFIDIPSKLHISFNF